MPAFVAPAVNIGAGLNLGSGGRSGSQVTYVVGNAGSFNDVYAAQKEDKEDDRATMAAVVGGIVTVVLAGVSALVLRSYCNDLEVLDKAQAFKDDLKNNQDLQPGANGMNNVNRLELSYVVDQTITALESKCARSRNITIVTGGALAAGIAAFVGGMLSIKWLVTASIIAGVAFAAIALFMIVWNCTTNDELPPDVAAKVATLHNQFQVSGFGVLGQAAQDQQV